MPGRQNPRRDDHTKHPRYSELAIQISYNSILSGREKNQKLFKILLYLLLKNSVSQRCPSGKSAKQPE